MDSVFVPSNHTASTSKNSATSFLLGRSGLVRFFQYRDLELQMDFHIVRRTLNLCDVERKFIGPFPNYP